MNIEENLNIERIFTLGTGDLNVLCTMALKTNLLSRFLFRSVTYLSKCSFEINFEKN